jgi:hypothetical protein
MTNQLSMTGEHDELAQRVARLERHLLELESKYEHMVEAFNAGKFAFKLSDQGNLLN